MVGALNSTQAFQASLFSFMDTTQIYATPFAVQNGDVKFGPEGTAIEPLDRIFSLPGRPACVSIKRKKQPVLYNEHRVVEDVFRKWEKEHGRGSGVQFVIAQSDKETYYEMDSLWSKVIVPFDMQMEGGGSNKRGEALLKADLESAYLHYVRRMPEDIEWAIVHLCKASESLVETGHPLSASMAMDMAARLRRKIKKARVYNISPIYKSLFFLEHNRETARLILSGLSMVSAEPISYLLMSGRGIYLASMMQDFELMEMFFADSARRKDNPGRSAIDAVRAAWARTMSRAAKGRHFSEEDWRTVNAYLRCTIQYLKSVRYDENVIDLLSDLVGESKRKKKR